MQGASLQVRSAPQGSRRLSTKYIWSLSKDSETRQAVAAAAAGSAKQSWDGPLTEFLAALDPGSAHDWVRAAVGERNR